MLSLSVKNLSKNYGTFPALQGVSFDVNKGDCLGLLGSNGAGKSTAIKIITGQLKPNEGSVEIFGLNPTREPKKVHPYLGYIPDSQCLYEDLTVKDNIEIFRRLNQQKKSRTIETIEELDLTDKANAKVKVLSKGLRQRVLIARALVHKPKLVVLDEPTSGLDPSSAEDIYEIIEKLKENGSTILLTTHLMNDVERLCNSIVFLNRGKTVAAGTPFELKRKFKKAIVEIKTLAGDVLTDHQFNMGGDWLAELMDLSQHADIYSIHSHEPRLEDIFIELIGARS